MDGEANDLVILVHGTGAGDKETRDEGERWWQRDSEVWRWMEDHLPPGTSLLESPIKLFHWSGDNSQVARLEASGRLLALLLELERKGRKYHLVGHSHGGSIIWEALISAEVTRQSGVASPELRRSLNNLDSELRGPLLTEHPLISLRPGEYAPRFGSKLNGRYFPDPSEFGAVRPFIRLDGLRSWTTVGTPFLHHMPKQRFMTRGWPNRRFSLYPTPWQTVRAELCDTLLRIVLILPILAIIPVAFFAHLPTGPFADLMAWPILGVWISSFFLLSNRSYAFSLVFRERASHSAMDRFCGRWLGLWATEDEAIAALKFLAQPSGEYDYAWLCATSLGRDKREAPPKTSPVLAEKVPNLKVPTADTHLMPHVLSLAPARVAAPAILAYNRFVAPLVSRKIIEILRRAGQGADLPHASLIYVSPWPLPMSKPHDAGLPATVNAEIQQYASRHTGDLGLDARRLFMTAALEGVPTALSALQEAGGASASLVHTSYFDHPSVRRLIALHIRRKATKNDGVADSELLSWLEANEIAVQERWDEFRAAIGRS